MQKKLFTLGNLVYNVIKSQISDNKINDIKNNFREIDVLSNDLLKNVLKKETGYSLIKMIDDSRNFYQKVKSDTEMLFDNVGMFKEEIESFYDKMENFELDKIKNLDNIHKKYGILNKFLIN